MPKFSIVIPTYNRGALLIATIQSLLKQSFTDFEVIIVDDGSTDNTKELLSKISDHRLIYLNQENQERAVARNTGINRATGDYVTFLDSDDIVYTNHLEEAFELISQKNEPDWFHLNYEIVDEKGNIIKNGKERINNLRASLVTGNHLSCIGVFIRKEISKSHKFDENRDLIGSEDYEFWLRLAGKYRLEYSNVVTAALIQHPNRSVIGFSAEKLENRIKYLIEKEKQTGLFNNKARIVFIAHRYLYLALHLVMVGHYSKGYNYLLRSLKLQPSLIVSVKVLGIIKNTLFK